LYPSCYVADYGRDDCKQDHDVPCWHLASIRCDTEFGPLSAAHIGHRVAIKLDLWVRTLVAGL
jgi:hypothetical protein